jgi:predicted phosphodiesterase
VARIQIVYKQSTRVIIFGDLHANWEALVTLQQTEPRPLTVLCLGDLVGYGPDPKSCLDAVRASATHVIGGWHDRAVSDSRLQSGDDLLEGTWAYTRSMLRTKDRDYLAGLPSELTVEVAGARFHLTRFAPDDLETETYTLVTAPQARLRELFGHIEADVILVGGPHIPAMRQLDGRLIVCPGSLGLPRYGVPDPTFAAWQAGRLQIHHLHYQPQDTARKLSLLPLDPEHVLRLQSILQTGGLEGR